MEGLLALKATVFAKHQRQIFALVFDSTFYPLSQVHMHTILVGRGSFHWLPLHTLFADGFHGGVDVGLFDLHRRASDLDGGQIG